MANTKDKQTTPPKTETGTNTGTGTGTGTGKNTRMDGSVVCSMQDIWGFLTSMQEMMMRQSEDIKKLTLKNQELEHTIRIQDMKITQQEEKFQALQDTLNKQATTQEEKNAI